MAIILPHGVLFLGGSGERIGGMREAMPERVAGRMERPGRVALMASACG
jgi:hypothetical protein